jgi:hypothetical protein
MYSQVCVQCDVFEIHPFYCRKMIHAIIENFNLS